MASTKMSEVVRSIVKDIRKYGKFNPEKDTSLRNNPTHPSDMVCIIVNPTMRGLKTSNLSKYYYLIGVLDKEFSGAASYSDKHAESTVIRRLNKIAKELEAEGK